MPLYDKVFDHPNAAFRCPNVIPCATQDADFKRMLPLLDMYAARRGWIVQPVLFNFRPGSLMDLEDGRQDMSITKLRMAEHQLPLSERVTISLAEPGIVDSVCRELVDLCAPILKEMGIVPEVLSRSNWYGNIIHQLIANYPFLVHHIFNAYPNLCALFHTCKLAGSFEFKIAHIRVTRDDFIARKPSVIGDMRDVLPNVMIP